MPRGTTPPSPPARPLSGIRIVDLTNVLAGPYCSYQLALLGAEVVKVELPGRATSPPSRVRSGAQRGRDRRLVPRAERGQEVGRARPEDPCDQAAFRDMVGGADVLLENFRAGVLDRMGFGWPLLRELNPRLVYCAISGFGQTGPMRTAPAYDQVIQGLSGIMSITGTPQTAPLRVGFPICDTVGGLMAALSIAAALAGRAKTGEAASSTCRCLRPPSPRWAGQSPTTSWPASRPSPWATRTRPPRHPAPSTRPTAR